MDRPNDLADVDTTTRIERAAAARRSMEARSAV